MPSPILGYVSAIDVTDSGNGSSQYNIFFDSIITTSGNLLMFEYKLQPANVTNPTPAQITLAFVNTENSSQMAGISNQWRISVPAIPTTLPIFDYDPTIPMEIRVRVYYGVLGTPDINVTDWSNALNVHNPPNQPEITFALYNTPSVAEQDDLYIVLETDAKINYDEVKFIVAYYYQDASNNTVWTVSDLLTATTVIYNSISSKLLTMVDFGNVSDGSNAVYAAVYAVFPFTYTDTSGTNNYYSVSHISNTKVAGPSDQFDAPTITNINYKVYNTVSEQKMTITWTPPPVEIMPIYEVAYYVLEYLTNVEGATWTTVPTTSPITALTYDMNVSNLATFPKNATVIYRVKAISTTGTISPYSGVVSKNMFYYSTAPQNLTITGISVNSDSNSTVNMTVNFENPMNIGSGDPLTAYFTIIIDGQTQATVQYVSGSSSPYVIPYINLDIASSGTVEVYLNTDNTNPNPVSPLAGASITTTYAASVLELTDPVYNIYNTIASGLRAQTMYLEWTNIVISGWTVTYEVKLRLNGTSTGTVPGGTTMNNSFTYSIPVVQQVCTNQFVFQVVATLTKSGSPTYTITSNLTATEYMFKYAQAPTVHVNWASANPLPLPGTMDVLVTFSQPDAECGDPTGQVFTVKVYAADNINVIDTKTVTYDGDIELNANYPSLLFNNIPLSQTGKVKVYLTTIDTNSTSTTEEIGAIGEDSYTSGTVPIYVDDVYTPTSLTFDIISQTVLAEVAGIVLPEIAQGALVNLGYVRFSTATSSPQNITFPSGTTGSLTITPVPVSENYYQYSVTLLSSVALPVPMGIVTANEVGIGELPVGAPVPV